MSQFNVNRPHFEIEFTTCHNSIYWYRGMSVDDDDDGEEIELVGRRRRTPI